MVLRHAQRAAGEIPAGAGSTFVQHVPLSINEIGRTEPRRPSCRDDDRRPTRPGGTPDARPQLRTRFSLYAWGRRACCRFEGASDRTWSGRHLPRPGRGGPLPNATRSPTNCARWGRQAGTRIDRTRCAHGQRSARADEPRIDPPDHRSDGCAITGNRGGGAAVRYPFAGWGLSSMMELLRAMPRVLSSREEPGRFVQPVRPGEWRGVRKKRSVSGREQGGTTSAALRI